MRGHGRRGRKGAGDESMGEGGPFGGGHWGRGPFGRGPFGGRGGGGGGRVFGPGDLRLVLLTVGFFAAHSLASGWVGRRSAKLPGGSPAVAGSLYLFC